MRHDDCILVVDDNPVNVDVLREMLAEEFRVETAENGEDAIRLAQKLRPTVVLLDVMMPGIDGLEVCRRLRELAGLRSIAIVMVSAKAMSSERAAGIAAGADDYITKPFDEFELLNVVRRYMQPI